jgi:hypothetical protein
MNSYVRGAAVLPNTGLALTVFGVTFGGAYLLAVAVALVLVGAVLIRVGWRHDRAVSAR